MKEILETYGFTEGCPGCRMKKSGMGAKRPHTEACRKRMTQELQKDPEGKKIIDKH